MDMKNTLQDCSNTTATPPQEEENVERPILHSPDGKIEVELSMKNGQPFWKIDSKKIPLIKDSALGLITESELGKSGFKVVGCLSDESDTTYKTVWGKHAYARNCFCEIRWELEEKSDTLRRMDIIVRAYNDGVAISYKLYGDGEEKVVDDITSFEFTADHTCWSANGEKENVGPVKLSEYEGCLFPFTVKLSEDSYCSILEAAIYEYGTLLPKRIGPTAFRTAMPVSVVTLPSETSWRVFLIADRPGALLESNLLTNLNPPCKIEDTSWIKPGLAMWDWRAWGGKDTDGFKYNLDMASWRRFIDFASRKNIGYLVLDANWYGHERKIESNPIKSRTYLVYQPDPTKARMATKEAPADWDDPIDIPKLIKYGKERNVGIILYINDIARDAYDFEHTLATYHKWGAVGIKYGFMKRKDQDQVVNTREIVELCAKYELICDFHDGPIPPSGDRRTYPNYLTREFCHAQSDALSSFSPTTFCTTVFCNMLAGPLDMNNGLFMLDTAEQVRPKIFTAVNSTVVAETARVMIVFSGLAILPDTPSSYEAKADLFEYITKLPMTWDETRILNGKIGEYITTARRSGDSWVIASCCNEEGAELSINFDFLEEGKVYKATLYEDAPDAHYLNNKEVYRVRDIEVKKGETIQAILAPGGGHCISIAPIKE